MKNMFSRREALRLSAAAAILGALPACTVINGKNTTTLVLNVAKIRAYAQAGLNAASTILSIPPVSAALGAGVAAAISVASEGVSAALSAFESEAGDQVTIVYNSDSLKSKVDALLTALENLSQSLAKALASVSTELDEKTRADVTTALDALSTIVAIFQALLSGTIAVGAPYGRARGLPMTEAQALAALHVTA
ncbi:hypothetical protein N5W20_06725 [Candidatus Kirkpatrickella diaphorinae]|uniref:Uncharacterized protein n=1 Tax=Candidatus Kirkpatrickella diaphorinae TaxID=2984322 RepID=A0ABY6GHL9_9PROT|nr:hypothetical protein [Candidatus Kirkpatrickella diaphorinae]UYH50799.1 hypothetical protein N5W20_06725 [Candidatus Kirkpatrickella diaphorinae]